MNYKELILRAIAIIGLALLFYTIFYYTTVSI